MHARRRGCASGHRTQQNNTKGMRTPAPRAPLGSPPAAGTRPGVLQQTRAVSGAGAALPRCPGPLSRAGAALPRCPGPLSCLAALPRPSQPTLKRAPSNFSNRDAMGAAAPRPSTRTLGLCTGTRGIRVRCAPGKRSLGRAARAAGRRCPLSPCGMLRVRGRFARNRCNY